MSIFPRRLTRGENCIIHLKFTNSSRILKKLHYNLKILNPEGEIIKDVSDEFILGSDKEEFKKEFYYCFNTDSKTGLGKYRVIPTFYYDGVKLKSQTSNYDFFVVEEIEYRMINDKEYCLTNLSQEETRLEFIKHNLGKIEYSDCILKGNETKKFEFDSDRIFIKYGNNFIKEILKDKDIIYERKYDIFWKDIENKVLIYREETREKIILTEMESIIWKLLNGINTNKYISDKTGFDINEIEKVEYKLENMFLITKCRGIHG